MEQAKGDNVSLCKQKAQRQKAFEAILALDHQLEAVGSGLGAFATSQNTRCRPLASSGIRYKVLVEPPPGVVLLEDVRAHRLAIRDRVTGKKRWEVPACIGDRPHLALFTDHGSEMVALACFLMFGKGARIDWFSDYYHDTNNDISLAASGANLTGFMHETTFLMNWEHGPWQSCAHWQKGRHAWAKWISKAQPSDDLYG